LRELECEVPGRQGKQLVAHAETVDPPVTGKEFGEWVELILGSTLVSLPLCILALEGI